MFKSCLDRTSIDVLLTINVESNTLNWVDKRSNSCICREPQQQQQQLQQQQHQQQQQHTLLTGEEQRRKKMAWHASVSVLTSSSSVIVLLFNRHCFNWSFRLRIAEREKKTARKVFNQCVALLCNQTNRNLMRGKETNSWKLNRWW